jgi:hypothetical protein
MHDLALRFASFLRCEHARIGALIRSLTHRRSIQPA